MASKRTVLEHLSRDELLVVADRFDLAVADRRAKDGLVDAVASSKKATLAEILPELSRDRLKEICRALDLDDSGREKSLLITRLSGGSPAGERTGGNGHRLAAVDPVAAVMPPSSPPPPSGRSKRNGANGAKKNGAGDLGFEATLWLAADKLRNNLDAAEYKHVVLGLIFLKYISDAFQELATWCALAGLGTTALQRRMGHESPSTTDAYVKQAEDVTAGGIGAPFPALDALVNRPEDGPPSLSPGRRGDESAQDSAQLRAIYPGLFTNSVARGRYAGRTTTSGSRSQRGSHVADAAPSRPQPRRAVSQSYAEAVASPFLGYESFGIAMTLFSCPLGHAIT